MAARLHPDLKRIGTVGCIGKEEEVFVGCLGEDGEVQGDCV